MMIVANSALARAWPNLGRTYTTQAHPITAYLPPAPLVFASVGTPWDERKIDPAALDLAELGVVDAYLQDVARDRDRHLPNVLLIMLESIPAQRMGYLGYGRDTTPAIDSIAADGVVFERCMAAANESQRGQTSIHASVWPMRGKNAWFDDITYPRLLVWQVFKALGYHTALISTQNEHWTHMSSFHLSAGDAPDIYLHAPDIPEGPSYETLGKKDAETINRRLLEYVRDRTREGRRWLLLTNYQRTHFPMPLPPKHDPKFKPAGDDVQFSHFRRLRQDELSVASNRFDSALTYVDHHVGRLVHGLDELGVLENTIVVVVSDHGSGFEANKFPVSESLADTYVRVPCLIRYPRVLHAQRFAGTVSTIDLVPTVLGVLGVPPSPAWDGTDVLALGEAGCGRRPVFTANLTWRNQWLVTRGATKLVFDIPESSATAYELGDSTLARPRVLTEREIESVGATFFRLLNERYYYYTHPYLHDRFLYPVYTARDWN